MQIKRRSTLKILKSVPSYLNFKRKEIFKPCFPTLSFNRRLLQSEVRGYVLDYHETGCSAETEYTVAASFPWNKLPSVLPKFHLSITDVAFIVHNDRYGFWWFVNVSGKFWSSCD